MPSFIVFCLCSVCELELTECLIVLFMYVCVPVAFFMLLYYLVSKKYLAELFISSL